MSDSAMGDGRGPSGKSAAFAADAKRKKSLMTRLIPGRAGSAQTLHGKLILFIVSYLAYYNFEQKHYRVLKLFNCCALT